MTDVLTPEQRSYNMSRTRGAHPKHEVRVRRALHAMGLRYRPQRDKRNGKSLKAADSRGLVVRERQTS